MSYHFTHVISLCSILAAGAAGAGCASSTASQGAVPPTGGLVQMQVRQPIQGVIPDTCGVSKTVKINPDGGSEVGPMCDKTYDAFAYPRNSGDKHFTSTLTEYVNCTPSSCPGFGLPSGETVVAEMSVIGTDGTRGSIKFGGNCGKQNPTCESRIHSLGALLQRRNTYTLFIYVNGTQVLFNSLGNPTCGRIECSLRFPSPLLGRTLPLNTTFWFELASP